MRAPRSGCVGRELLADRHEAGHLGLGDGDLLAAPVGERQVGDVEVGELGACRSVRSSSLRRVGRRRETGCATRWARAARFNERGCRGMEPAPSLARPASAAAGCNAPRGVEEVEF